MRYTLKFTIVLCIAIVQVSGCCNCKDDELKYKQYIGIDDMLYSTPSYTAVIHTVTYTKDTLCVGFHINDKCVAAKTPQFSIITQAQAFQCDCFCGELGSKYKITAINVLPTAGFGNINAPNINNIVRLRTRSTSMQYITLQQYADTINNSSNTYNGNVESRLYVVQKPSVLYNGGFKLQIILNNQDTITGTSSPITWQ